MSVPRAVVWAGRLSCAPLGLYTCILAAVVHRLLWPGGLVLGLVATVLMAMALTRYRGAAEAFAIGWAVGLAPAMGLITPTYLVALDLPGVSFLIGGVGGVFAVLWWTSRSRGRRPR